MNNDQDRLQKRQIYTIRPWLWAVLLAPLAWGYSDTREALAMPKSKEAFKLEALEKPNIKRHEIAVWVRKPGLYGTKQPHKNQGERIFHTHKMTLQTKKLTDHQSARSTMWQGFYVRQLLKRYRVPKTIDLALLHFDNKVVIPLPLREKDKAKKIRVFVALAWKDKKEWKRAFPPFSKKDALFRDTNPIRFDGNKIIVTQEIHPYVLKHIANDLKVWRYASALRGIELVQKGAYYKQFDVPKNPVAQQGLQKFMGSCQFCHGVRKVGAGFGVDFTKPVSVHLYINQSNHLHHHVRNRALFSSFKSLKMPAITNMTKPEVEAIWKWMQALWKKKKLEPYQPTTPDTPTTTKVSP